jgi:hypothetical protein
MRYHTTTVALAALAAAIALPATAQAKAHHEEVEKVSVSSQVDIAQAEIRQQQAQIDLLKSLVEKQSAAIAALQGQTATLAPAVANATATANTAAATATAANTVATKDRVVVDAVKWASNTQVHGAVFFNASTITQNSNGGRTTATGTGVNIKRVYIGVDHQFDKVFSASLLADVSNVAGSSSSGNNASFSTSTSAPVGRGFYVKNAYIQAKIDPALIIRVGAAPLPWVPYVEGYNGHRYVENMLLDRVSQGSVKQKLGTTADYGVHVLGDLFGGLISYQVSAIDGSGYRDVNVTKYVDFEGRVSAQYKGFFAAVGGYDGHLGQSVSAATPTVFTPVLHTARRIDAAAGYKNAIFSVGGEYYYAKDYASVLTTTQDSSLGYSVFGSVNLNPKWQVFGRYDWDRSLPNITTQATRVSDHYFNVGLQWEPVKIVDLSLIYKREAVDNGSLSTQNGTVGGSGNGTYDEVGLFGQLKF